MKSVNAGVFETKLVLFVENHLKCSYCCSQINTSAAELKMQIQTFERETGKCECFVLSQIDKLVDPAHASLKGKDTFYVVTG